MWPITQFYSIPFMDAFDKHLLSSITRSDHSGLVSTESTDRCWEVLVAELFFVY